ncbi:putative glycerophosphoryl diester phosphodiesterase 1 [Corynebacterium occultum]|uniref:Putative glycerophosphoryl diester phosphodiesterase 1 n=1 Tax=Corynebacterium occultum TaxID=2675219 RepID=A0A6B8VWQ3_9CORY|nr:glycerophosphodiester phosphodiesterase [Corynebacterium occultum]QGU08563.1 putative glycerophosphoryl diester phosphodiesterase 1 [Corynebacterium occultum]
MKLIAHRGLSSLYPELTEIAFAKALELDIHGVETDVRLSKDGIVVCVHDPIIDRVADGRGRVSELTLQQLRGYNFGTEAMKQSVLTLDELLEMLVQYEDKHLYIETKHPVRFSRILEEQVVLRLRYHGLLFDPRIHIISFAASSITWMKEMAPQLDRIHLRRSWEKWLNPVPNFVGHPTGLGISVERARKNPEFIGKWGLPTYVWTVDNASDIRWAKKQGVDMLATNVPGRAAALLARN